MKKLKIIPLILMISILVSLVVLPHAAALDDPQTGAASVILYERNTRQVLYEKNADAQVYPASTTKIMTALLAVEAVEAGSVALTDQVTASDAMNYDLIPDGSSANIQVGETMSLGDLLYCAMLVSGNDACNVIAEYIGGSISNFVAMMNSRAAELGCTGTHFANAHGVPDESHYTTARDFMLIADEAASHSTFMEICNSATHTVPATNLSEERNLVNSNALISTESIYGDAYYYEYAAGIKTGHTSAAGYCLVSTASNNGMDLIAVVMGGVATDDGAGNLTYGNFTDSIALYEWAFANFSYRDVLTSTENVTTVDVEMGGDADSVGLRPQSAITLLLPNDADLSEYQQEMIIYSQRDGEDLVAPITAGEVLGEVTVTHNGTPVGTVNLIAASSIDLSRLSYMQNQIAETLSSGTVRTVIWILAILFILYLVWVIVYRVRRVAHLATVRKARKARAHRLAQAQANALYQEQDPVMDFFTEDEPAAQPPQAPEEEAPQEDDPYAALFRDETDAYSFPETPAEEPEEPEAAQEEEDTIHQ